MLQLLRGQVEIKFGRGITYQKDCKALADCVLEGTGSYISPSTLRRVFGFLPTNSNPSRATLNTLALYCGYDDWESFQYNQRDHKDTEIDTATLWSQAQQKAESLSSTTCQEIKKAVPFGYSHAVPRHFARERLAFFLNSNYRATAFIGPGGYGKSTLLAKWYEEILQQREYSNDIIIFLQASTLSMGVDKHIFPDAWLQSMLGIDPPTLFSELVKHPQKAKGRVILILDALDEAPNQGSKTDQLLKAIHKLVEQNANTQWFKVIITSRFPAWQRFSKLGLNKNQWFFVHGDVTSRYNANMPPLNENEVQRILNSTINREQVDPIVVEQIPQELLNAIAYPYYLQLYINIIKADKSSHLADRLDLLVSFVKSQVYTCQLSDEKSDILESILSLTQEGKKASQVKKNDLKAILPVHLKSEGNYYSAYNQLQSFGIIVEENVENRYGSYIKCVRVGQDDLLEFLIVQRLIQSNEGLSFKLFKYIEQEYTQSKLQPRLISLLFQIAYKERNLKALKLFFNLKEETLSSVFDGTEVLTTLRNDDLMRRELIPHYSRQEKAHQFLFDGFIDLDNIITSGKFLVQNYMHNNQCESVQFLARTLLNFASLLSIDIETVRQNSDFFSCYTTKANVKPLVEGVWFTCRIIHDKLLKQDVDIESFIDEVEDCISERREEWGRADRLEFELGLSIGMIITRNHAQLLGRLDSLLGGRPKEDKTPIEKALTIYLEYARWNLSRNFLPEIMHEVEYNLNELPCGISYHPSIIGRSFLSLYYLKQGKMEQSYEQFQKAMQICTISGYRICEVKILKHLTVTLRKLNEERKAQEYEAFAKGLLANTGIAFEVV